MCFDNNHFLCLTYLQTPDPGPSHSVKTVPKSRLLTLGLHGTAPLHCTMCTVFLHSLTLWSSPKMCITLHKWPQPVSENTEADKTKTFRRADLVAEIFSDHKKCVN